MQEQTFEQEAQVPKDTKSAFDYDIDAPVQQVGKVSNTVPSAVVAEESMLGAFIKHPSPTMDMVRSIEREYAQYGASPAIEGLRTDAAKRINQQAIAKEFKAHTNGEQSLQELETRLRSTPAKTEDDIFDLHQEMMVAVLGRNQAKTVEDQIIAGHKIEELVERGYPVQQAIQDRIEWLKAEMDPDAFGMTTGILRDVLPFATTIPFIRAFNEVFPDDTLDLTDMPRGELQKELRARLSAMPPEQAFRVASDFMDSIISTQGTLTGSAFQKLMILQEGLEDDSAEVFGVGTDSINRFVGNAITLLDFVGLGGVSKQLFKGVKSIFKPGSVLSTLNIADPTSAGKLAAEGIKQDLSASIGMTPKDIVEVVAVPSKWRSNIELLPANIIKMLDDGAEIISNLMARTKSNPLATTAVEQRENLRGMRNTIKQVGNNGLYGANFTARMTDDGIEFTAKYGVITSEGEVVPFKTAAEAFEAAAHQFPDGHDLKIFQRMPKGNLVEVSGKTPKTGVPSNRVGEFVYEVSGSKTHAHLTSTSEKALFGETDIVATGPLAKWGLDPASRFAKWISSAFAQAGDHGRGIKHELMNLTTPIVKMSLKKQREMVKLLQRYAKDAENMDTAKIIQLADGDEEVLRGFMAYRQTMDALWELENRNLRNDYLQQGVKHIVNGSYQGVGVKVPQANVLRAAGQAKEEAVDVFDAATGQLVSLDAKRINKLYADGKSLYRTKEPMGDLSRQSDLVIVTDASQVRQLPAHVLKKIDGYIPRYYKDTYFIRKSVAGKMNGRSAQNFQILRAVGDKAEANNVVKQLVSEGKLTAEEAKRAIIHDRSLAPAERSTINQQDNISLGRMFYHQRNAERLRGIDGLAEVSDPIEAMVKNLDSTSKYVGQADLLHTMKQRWMNTFGSKYGLVNADSAFPSSKAEIGGSFTGTTGEKAQALEMWEHIRMTESVHTSEGDAWRNMFVGIADGIIGERTSHTVLTKMFSGAAKFVADNSPNVIARKFAFNLLIAANPIRQLYVQSQQFTYLAALTPTKMHTVMNRGWAMRHGVLKDTSPVAYNLLKDRAAKQMGMSTAEYEHYIKMFGETGLPYSVNSHDYVAKAMGEFSSGLNQGKVMGAVSGLKKWAIDKPLAAGKLGFNHGELVNLTNTFAAAEIRFLSRTGKTALKTKKDFMEVAADARNLALDMTRTGAFRYQEGGFSALTQFLSIQHKAWLAMNPFNVKIGANQALSVAERRRIFAGQVILNGATGVGVVGLYKQARDNFGFEFDPIIEDVIIGGLMEEIISQAVSAAAGEDIQLNIAGNVAPASGINQKAGDVLDVLWGHKPFLEVAAASNTYGRISDAAKTMWAMQTYPTLNNDEELTNMMSAFASITSGWNQAQRGLAAVRLGRHVSTSGSPTVQASFASSLAEGAFGIQQRSVEEFYELTDTYSNEYLNTTTPFDHDRETSTVAANLYKQMTKIVTLYHDEFDPDIAGLNVPQMEKLHLQKMNEALQMQAQILSLYDPIERDRIWQKFQEQAMQDRVNGVDGLLSQITKKIFSGDVSGHQAEVAINRIRASGLYDPASPNGQQIEQNLNALYESMMDLDTLSNKNLQIIQDMQ